MGFSVECPSQYGSIALVIVFGLGTEAFILLLPSVTVTAGDGVADKLNFSFRLPERWQDLTLLCWDES